MLMKTPRSADALSSVGIKNRNCVSKRKLSADWLNRHFRIKDPSITAEILAANEEWDGPCACPYNLNRANYRCGANSHYSKTNELQLKCYPKDVLDARTAKASGF